MNCKEIFFIILIRISEKVGELMANNFFELVNDGFFNPFTNRNKRYNYDLLQLINNKMSLDNLQVGKEEIVDWIIDYLDNCPIDMVLDETNEEDLDTRAYAYEKVRYFVKCGWLIEDFEGIRVTYQFDENGIKILSAMEKAVKDDTKSLEFSGYVYNIYNNLYYFNYDHAVDIVEQVYNASKELNSMLRGLNVNIKKFLQKLIRENEAMPKEILETIFFDYQKKVVLKAFKNFREKDNPSRYKLYIETRIEEFLKDDKMNLMISNYIKVKCDNISSKENLDSAREFFSTRLNYISIQFEEIEEYISMLDKKNTKYITTAQSRLNFLLNEETDIEGRIIECLKGIGNVSDSFFLDSCFDLYATGNIDEYSLYKPISRKAKPKPNEIEDDFSFDPILIKSLQDKLFKDNEFSVNKINEFVIKQLGDNNLIHAENIKINNFDDLLKVFLIKLYSENTSVVYKVKYLNESYIALGYKMKDFIIERKRS